ncbi:hypothetical protein P23_2824 [Acinetobacter calcoaceticus]|nr:hypothetical protein P23_2824 [Acinetobacter calcoaceticus]
MKMRKIILIIGGIISLVACSHDPINEVLDNKKDIPKEENRTVGWYKSQPQLSEEIKQACDIDTSKYFQRNDCINAKSALNLILIESRSDLSNNLRLNEDRKYLNRKVQ